MNTARLLRPLYALLAGAVHAYSFAPWNLPWLQVLALTALFALSTRVTSARSAAVLGFAFGMGWFGVGVSWVYVSMHVYGLMPAVLAAAATAAFCAYLAGYPALALGLAHKLFSGAFARLALGLPALWTITEWLRGTVLTGFPWLASGYAHTDGPLAGWAPTLGMYGITLAAALLAGAVSLLALQRQQHRRAVRLIAAVLVLVVGGGWFGQPSLGRSRQAHRSACVWCSNVPQNLKFGRTDWRARSTITGR